MKADNVFDDCELHGIHRCDSGAGALLIRAFDKKVDTKSHADAL